MGKIDIATKSYMSANTRFADIFNFCLYGGKAVLKAEDLVEKDPTEFFPVITLTLYWGTREWDGPKSLHEMLDVKDDNLWHYISDYRVNLILPQEIEDFSVFKTDLKQVLETIKVSKDKQKMKELFEGDEAFKSLDREAAMIIKNYTGLEYKFDESEEQWDMCQGLIDIKAEEREEGRKEILSSMISNMYEQGLSVEDIAKYTKLDLTEVKETVINFV